MIENLKEMIKVLEEYNFKYERIEDNFIVFSTKNFTEEQKEKIELSGKPFKALFGLNIKVVG